MIVSDTATTHRDDGGILPFRSIVEAASDGVAIIEAASVDDAWQFRWKYVNPPARQILELSTEPDEGSDIVPGLLGHGILQRCVEAGDEGALEGNWQTEDGRTIGMRAGLIDGLVVIRLRDLTQNEQPKDSERLARRRLSEIQRARSLVTLTGGVAHDFNNLLTVLTGHAALLAEALGEAHPALAHLTAIRSSAARAGDLTRQLLAYSEQQVVSPAPVDLNEVLRDAWQSLRECAGSAITVDVEFVEAPVVVNVDHRELVQCLQDLIGNARDAMPDGGTVSVAISVETTTVAGLRASQARPIGVISVADEGTGMTREVRAHAVEPFFTFGRGGQRTGLGLSAADGMVRQAGGQLRIESRAGEGTVVRISLPLCGVDPPSLPGESAGAEAADPKPSNSILVVDDNPDVRDLVTLYLSAQGYVVASARDGSSAIEVAQAALATPFDLVITDIVMPGQSGYELAMALTDDPDGPAVLFMSGFTSNSRPGLATSTVHGFLAKPFTAGELLDKVAELLAERFARRAKVPVDG